MKKWLVGWACVGMLTATAMGQASLPTTWSGSWTNGFLPTGWTNVGLGSDYSTATGGYDATGGGAARFDSTGDALTINFDSAPGEVTYWPRLNVGSGSWTTNIFKLQESSDGSGWSDVTVYDAGNPIPTTVPTGPYTSAPSASARYLRFYYEQKGNGNVGIDGVTIAAGGGGAATNVKFTASSETVDEDQGVYEITVFKTLAEGDVSGEIALSGTATEGAGADYTVDTTNFTMNGTTTSAVVTVTINDDEDSESAETIVLTLANVTGGTASTPSAFTLTINPSDLATYNVAITPATNGTVSTTPAGTATETETVTITATPDDGYRVAGIVVLDESSNPVTVTGNTFVMPASDVTVTVTFEVAPDFTLNFSDMPSLFYSNTATTANGVALDIDQCYRDANEADYAIRARWTSTNAGYFNNAAAFTNGSISKMIFRYKAYSGANTNYQFVVQFKTASGDWTQVGDTYLADSTNWMAGVVTNPPVGATYFRMQTVAPASGTDAKIGNFDDIGFWFGAAIFGVTFDQAEGFVIEEGTTDVIVATAANGAAPYAYSWTSTLGEAYRTADSNQFTILATAPVGDYSATVVATDNSAASVTNTINFSVKAPHAIAITPPTNGTVTTTPADEAIAGTTVTINPAPNAHYLVDQVTVTDTASNPVALTGNLFTMPDSDVIVTVTFVYHAPSTLIISEVADPSNNASAGRFVELYNAGASSIDLTAGNWFLARQINGGTSWGNIALTGTVSAGATYVVAGSTNFPTAYPSAAAPNQTSGTVDGNGDDGYFLYSGGRNTNGILEDAYGVVSQDGTSMPWDYTDRRAVRNAGITGGNPNWTAAEWTLPAVANTEDATPGVHPEGAVPFSVSFDKTNGFTVAHGASDAITATAANGTAPYGYSWTSTLGEGYRTAVDNVFTILATAPAGDYTATVTATDNAAQTASNVVSFTVLGGGASEWQIGDGADGGAMFYATSNRNIVIVLPTNYNLTAVYGTDSSSTGLNNLGQGTGSPLTENVDYTWTPATRTVNVLCGVTNRRVLRIGASAP